MKSSSAIATPGYIVFTQRSLIYRVDKVCNALGSPVKYVTLNTFGTAAGDVWPQRNTSSRVFFFLSVFKILYHFIH